MSLSGTLHRKLTLVFPYCERDLLELRLYWEVIFTPTFYFLIEIVVLFCNIGIEYCWFSCFTYQLHTYNYIQWFKKHNTKYSNIFSPGAVERILGLWEEMLGTGPVSAVFSFLTVGKSCQKLESFFFSRVGFAMSTADGSAESMASLP